MTDDQFFDSGFFGLEDDNLTQKRKLQLREGELREVTVLFADIKGFTNLSSRLDPEVIHARMDELLKVFSRCVTFYGGFVDKYIGDAIMALFGAKKASEQDTERAIRAGLKMLEQLQLYNHNLRQMPGYEDVELSVRIGINTGLVSVGRVGESREGDFTVYGPEVNLASRMESNAPVGRIMVPDTTKKLVEQIFEFEPLGLKQVKGIDKAVDCWSPLGLKTLEASLAERYGSSFIGRDTELRALEEALDLIIAQTGKISPQAELPAPRPVIIGIRADAGIGKSRLVYEFRKARSDSAEFIVAGCDGVSPTPLHLFARLLEQRFGLRTTEPVDAKLAKLQAAFSALEATAEVELRSSLQDAFPLIAWLLEIRVADPRLKQGGKDLLQHLLLAVNTVLEAVLVQCAQMGKPLVLVLDDLHWLDDSSSAVLEHLVNRFSQSKLPSLWLLPYRPEFDPPSYLARMRGFNELSLEPLDEKSITELVLKHTRHLDLSERSIEQVVSLSAGNPFYLEEWCNYVSSLGETQWQDMPVPASLNALILSRLDSLPQVLRVLLQKAAVIGQEFFVEILREVERNLEDPVDVDATLATLEDHSLIIKLLGFEFSSYLFKHITTREVAYQTLLITNRKVLHELTAEAIEALFPDRLDDFSFNLGTHYLKAELPQKALPWLRKAADSAARVFDNNRALDLYCQLLDLLPQEDYQQRGDILLQCIEIRWLTGAWKSLGADLDALNELGLKAGNPELCFHAQRLRGMIAFYKRQRDEAKVCWDQAAELAGRIENLMPRCMIENLMGIWYQDGGLWDQALERHQSSIALARSLADRQREAKSLNNIGLLHLARQEYEPALEAFQQSLELAQNHRYLKDESLAIGNLGHAYIVMGRMNEAMPYLEKKLELANRMNDKVETIKALGNMGRVHAALQEYDKAIACYERIIRIKQYLGDENGIKDTTEVLEAIKASAAAPKQHQ